MKTSQFRKSWYGHEYADADYCEDIRITRTQECKMKQTLVVAAMLMTLVGGAVATAGTASAQSRPHRPSVNCNNATARLAQLKIDLEALKAERAILDARLAANAGIIVVPGVVPGPKSEDEAAQLLFLFVENNKKMMANGQAMFDLARACGPLYPV